MMKRWILYFPAVLMLCFIFSLSCGPRTAFAAEEIDLSVTALADFGAPSQTTTAEVKIWFTGAKSTYYLFLPSMAEEGVLQVHYANVPSIELNGLPVSSGDTTDLFASGEDVEMKVGNKTYTLKVMRSANLPSMWITTQNGTLEQLHRTTEYEETADMLLLDKDGEALYQGPLTQIKGRGNATFQFPKKPYQIKLEHSTDLFGMGKCKTWLLLAEYNDYSMMRNRITFDMAAKVGLEYSSKSEYIDLYVDKEYKGTYLLCEKVHINENRIEITDLEKATEEANGNVLSEYPFWGQKGYEANSGKGYEIPENPEDITGGYLLELEIEPRYKPEMSGFVTRYGQAIVIKEPEFASVEQVAYIRQFFQSYENALSAEDGIDKETGKHYTQIMNFDSMVRKYIVEEIAKNLDANKTSQFYYKPADWQSTTAFAGPVWDYDSAYGNFAKSYNPRFASAKYLYAAVDTGQTFYFWPKAVAHEEFLAAVKTTYREQFVPALRVLIGEEMDPTGELKSLDDYAAHFATSAEMNRVRWPINRRKSHSVDTGETLEENIDFLRNFLSVRMAFLSETWQ